VCRDIPGCCTLHTTNDDGDYWAVFPSVEEGRCWNRFIRGWGAAPGAGVVVVVDLLNIVGFCPWIDFVGLGLLCRQAEVDMVLT